jgi:hypothetical protein
MQLVVLQALNASRKRKFYRSCSSHSSCYQYTDDVADKNYNYITLFDFVTSSKNFLHFH